jgi:biopolymer transport protein ExbB
MNLFLLQVQDSTLVTSSDAAGETLLDLVLYGGVVMIPIGLLCILGIYIFTERYLTLRKAQADPGDLFQKVRTLVLNGEIDRAKAYCDARNSPFSRIISKGLNRLGLPLNDITASVENEGRLEIHRLEKRIGLLATVSGAAPMLGFLGTVTGMIMAFMKIASLSESVSPADLASGIYQALITTAAGLFVGIPAYFAYNFLVGMVQDVVYQMELMATQFIDLLQEPAK